MGKKSGSRAEVALARVDELRKSFQRFEAQVTKQVEGIRLAFNKNHLAYTQAISNLDARISVLQAVINDLHAGNVTLTDDMFIAWDGYLEDYRLYLETLAEEERGAKEAADVAVAEVVGELQDEIFGGDYGAGTQKLGDRQVPEGVEEPAGEAAAGDGQGDPGVEHGSRPDADAVLDVPRDDEADESG